MAVSPERSRKLEARELLKPHEKLLRSLVRLPSQHEGKQLLKVLQRHIVDIGSQVDTIAKQHLLHADMLLCREIRTCMVLIFLWSFLATG